VIAAIGLLVFGPKRLPELGKTLGRTLKGFQSASSEFEREFRASLVTPDLDPEDERYLAQAAAPNAQPAALTQAAPLAQQAPVTQAAPLAQQTAVAQTAPLAQPTAVAQTAPVAQPTAVAQQAPVAQPTGLAQPAPVDQATSVAQAAAPVADPQLVQPPAVAGDDLSGSADPAADPAVALPAGDVSSLA
jgi:TatA/E family protein of Tat protein translocase